MKLSDFHNAADFEQHKIGISVLIGKFLEDLYTLRKGTKEDSFERYIINKSIEKWEKKLKEMEL